MSVRKVRPMMWFVSELVVVATQVDGNIAITAGLQEIVVSEADASGLIVALEAACESLRPTDCKAVKASKLGGIDR